VQNEFTRALNLYRRTERWNLEAFFTEELFGCFVQSGIRVNKVDVVERMLRSLKRARKEAPSKEFWQQTLKLMSSRKHFSLCLLAYSIFEHDMPVDKVIFSCLINAALELNAESRLEALLEKYSQASLSPKDHILHFRCYVQLNSADAAEQLFHRLGDEVSNLMLNMLLLTCVNQKQPERAYQLLQDAKVRETSAKDKLVDIVSYNTVMKGFGAAQMRSRCLDAVRDLIEHGLQPDDITLGALMEACVAESDHALAQQIGDVLISSGREVKPPMCNLFIRGLVKAGGIWKALALYEAMKKQQVRFPDIVLFSVLIKALVGQNALAKALELVEELQKAWRDKQRRKKQSCWENLKAVREVSECCRLLHGERVSRRWDVPALPQQVTQQMTQRLLDR
ncbi:Pentatricopeptide repeat-containing protein At1g03560, partial [Durusdinium trenchii]